MSPGETGGRTVAIVPQGDGLRSRIDVVGVAAEAVTPGSGKGANLFTGIEAACVTNPGWRNGFGQRESLDPTSNHRSQLRPGSHGRQLGHEVIKTAVDAPSDKKFQAVRKAVQLSRPIRHR